MTVVVLSYLSDRTTAECDETYCCCPTGSVSISTVSSRVSLQYGVTCPWTASEQNYECRIQTDGVCRTAFPGFIYEISKTEESMVIKDVRDRRCDLHLKCTSGACVGNDNWAGEYRVSSAKRSTSYLFLFVGLVAVFYRLLCEYEQ